MPVTSPVHSFGKKTATASAKIYTATAGESDRMFSVIGFNTPAGNTGKVYIGFVGMNKTTGDNVLRSMAASQFWELRAEGGSMILDPDSIILDSDNGTEVVEVYGIR